MTIHFLKWFQDKVGGFVEYQGQRLFVKDIRHARMLYRSQSMGERYGKVKKVKK